jgi:hypothetical protein
MIDTEEHLKDRGVIDNRYCLTKIYTDDSVKPGVRRYGLWKPVSLKSLPELPLDEGTYQVYTVTEKDIGRLDLVAWKYYQDVSWWWVIALFNHIKNQMTDLVIGQALLIPNKDVVAQAIENQS